jgi:hypothetical protein
MGGYSFCSDIIDADSLKDIAKKALYLKNNKEFFHTMDIIIYRCKEAAKDGIFNIEWDHELTSQVRKELLNRKFKIEEVNSDEYFYKISWE